MSRGEDRRRGGGRRSAADRERREPRGGSRAPRNEPIWTQRAPRSRRPRYTREQIAAAALGIADAEGYDAVSMRRVAAELGAGTMTLYHYVRTKDDLRALMDDAVMSELIVPEGELPDDWRAALSAIAHRTRDVFRRHPWMMGHRGESQSEGGPNGMRHFEQSLAAVANTGIDLERRLEIIAMVDDYVYGFAMREGGVEEAGMLGDIPEGLVEYIDAQLATGAYPHIAEVFGEGDTATAFRRMFTAMFDADRFARGLERLLDGIAIDIERAR